MTFVSLADEPVNLGAANSADATALLAPLKTHCESMSADGLKRIAVAMVNPATKGADDAAKIADRCAQLRAPSAGW